MITTDDYIKFVSNPILPAENKDEDLNPQSFVDFSAEAPKI